LSEQRHRDARSRGSARRLPDENAAAAAGAVSESNAHRATHFQLPMTKGLLTGTIALALLGAGPRAQQPPQPPPSQQPAPPPQQPTEIERTISGEAGAPPRLAVPDFIALSSDAETVAVAKTIGQVLWDDLNFEREFAFIPRDVYTTIPKATSFADVPFDRWRELNAD